MRQSLPLTEAELTILKRIERLPFGRFHWRLLWMGGMGYTFDAMDGAMIAFILPVVTALWSLTNQQTGVLGSSAMIGFGGVFVITTIVLVIGALTVGLLGIATAGKSLEQITAEEQRRAGTR